MAHHLATGSALASRYTKIAPDPLTNLDPTRPDPSPIQPDPYFFGFHAGLRQKK
jgi:hypothetical protein